MKRGKRFLSLLLLFAMIVTSLPVEALASGEKSGGVAGSSKIATLREEPNATEGDGSALQEDIPNPTDATAADETALNKYPVTPVKWDGVQPLGDTAQPATYTTRINYLYKEEGKDPIQLWQPYIATVGAKENSISSKDVPWPDLPSFGHPEGAKDTISWDFVKDNNGKTLEDVYSGKTSKIQVKHKFQSLNDPTVFEGERVTEQEGQVGSQVTVNPLPEEEREGFNPEPRELTTWIPSTTDDAVEFELHYYRQNHTVRYESMGGSETRAKQLYYGQAIPAVKDPTKEGENFQGWKADCDLKASVGDTITKGTLIHQDDFETITMPAHDVKFTAQWDAKAEANYTVLFWAEKSDYDDKSPNLTLRDRYDYIGFKVEENQPVGVAADLSKTEPLGIKFPDVNEAVTKTEAGLESLGKYYHRNEGLMAQENQGKTTGADGKTAYNVYYDREVYELVFEKHSDLNAILSTPGGTIPRTFDPVIEKDGVTYEATQKPYTVRARYYQSLVGLWPLDDEVKNWGPDRMGQGWRINGQKKDYVDTPPYRLTETEFISKKDLWRNFVSRPDIALGDHQISLGISPGKISDCHPVHVDFEKEGFDGKYSLDYSLYYIKSDTNGSGYFFPGPTLKGFELKNTKQKQSYFNNEVFNRKSEDSPEDLLDPTLPSILADFNAGRPSDHQVAFQKDIFGKTGFAWNGYVRFKYQRKKFNLYLDNDPENPREATQFGLGEQEEVYYDRPLTDLKLDETHIPSKPEGVPKDYEFKGWALDPSGENLVKDGHEHMPNYNKTLYAKWGPEERYWTVTIDPNGGTYDGKQEPTQIKVLEGTTLDKETLKEKLSWDKHDFNDFELVLMKDGQEDPSYKDRYQVPALYAFENAVVEDIYLRAIWTENKSTTMTVRHEFYDLDGNALDSIWKEEESDGQIGSSVTVAADYHGRKYEGKEWVLLENDVANSTPSSSAVNTLQGKQSRALRDAGQEDNLYFRQKTLSENADENIFVFKYRPFRQRTYTTKYVDEQDRDLIGPYSVTNGNKDFDARNYRPIKGYKLVSDPQQQLVFNLDEKGTFLGINDTGKTSVTFRYKDVRLLERDSSKDETPEGYHAVIFKAGDHGTFDENEPDKGKEKVYNAIAGLKFSSIPELTPTDKDGYTFVGWEEALPDGDTAIERDYTFVAQWEKKVNVSYQFKGLQTTDQGETPKDLPKTITNQQPQPEEKKVGDMVSKPTTTYNSVEITEGDDQGTWTFTGWGPESLKVKDNPQEGENVFTGTWTFEPKAKAKVKYVFSYKGAGGRTAPSEANKTTMEGLKPKDAEHFVDSMIAAPGSIKQTFNEETDVKGQWAFTGWDLTTDQKLAAEGLTFTGTWTFTEREKVNLTYKFAFKKSEQTLEQPPAAVEATLPETKQIYKDDDLPEMPDYKDVSYDDTQDEVPGKWTFTGWVEDTSSSTDTSQTYVGTWSFTPEDKVNVLYEFAYVGEDGKTIAAPSNLGHNPPVSKQVYKTQDVAAPTDSYEKVETEEGTWTFEGWDPSEGYAKVSDNVTFTGTWKFTKFDKEKYPPQGGTVNKDFGQSTTEQEIIDQVTIPGYTGSRDDLKFTVTDTKKIPDGKTSGTFYVPVEVTFPDGSSKTVDVMVVVGSPLSEQYPPKATTLVKEFGHSATKEEVLGQISFPNYPQGKDKPKMEITDSQPLPDGSQPGSYQRTVTITYPDGSKATIEVTILVKAALINAAPVITASDQELSLGADFDPLKGVTASDAEDGDLTDKIKVVENKVDTSKPGTYTVTYEVTDSQGAKTRKTIKVVVKPLPEASDWPGTPGQPGGWIDGPGTSPSEVEQSEPSQTGNEQDQSAKPAGHKLWRPWKSSHDKAPNTGDRSFPYLLLLVLALATLLLSRRWDRKKKR